MNIYIVGAGGVGGFYGAHLARYGQEVTFVARGETYEALKGSGLTVRTPAETWTVAPVRVIATPDAIQAPALVIVAVKVYDLSAVAQQLRPLQGQGLTLLTLQNGIDADQRVQAILPDAVVFAGTTWILTTRVEPGVIVQRPCRTAIHFGCRDSPNHPGLTQVRALFQLAGIDAVISSDIRRELWDKFLWLVNFAGMTGVHRQAIGPLVNDAMAYETWLQAIDETLAVAKALDIPIAPTARARLVRELDTYKHTNTTAKPSLLLDLEHDRPTEIEALSGTLTRLGRAVGVPTPLHDLMYSVIRLQSGTRPTA